MRLSQVARKLNVGTASIVSHLRSKGFEIDNKPNSKVTPEQFKELESEFSKSATDKKEASEVEIGESYNISKSVKQKDTEASNEKIFKAAVPKLSGLKELGKINIKPKENKADKKEFKKTPEKKPIAKESILKKEIKKESISKDVVLDKVKRVEVQDLKGLTVVGEINLPSKQLKPKSYPNKSKEVKGGFLQVASSDDKKSQKINSRKRIDNSIHKRKKHKKDNVSYQPSDKEIQEHIKNTLAKLSRKGSKSDQSRAKYKKEKRIAIATENERRLEKEKKDAKILKVTEFISAGDLASIMNVSIDKVLAKCLELGMFVSINQRLDAETITIIADEFDFEVQFTSTEIDEIEDQETEDPKNLESRPPVVTIMGHVDHGKTLLLDYIRNSKVLQSEAGGITQHIGAYDVTNDEGKQITFLDTPGHEAFTAMRARGTQITDIVVVVIAADDNVMPQTKEAINHAQLANVPIIIAINKIDKPQANIEKIKEELSKINILVEDWGGKYQCQPISAKTGEGVNELLEKVLLEAEILELKANPNKQSSGTVIEASLDQGRGYIATLMVQSGTLNKGDTILAGVYYGKVKAMFDHKGDKIDKAGPSKPVQVLGFNGAPQSGEKFKTTLSDKEARDLALKRQQVVREQQVRTKKHITLEEVGKRLALGNFRELKLIIKGDVDGSVEALTDSLLNLSTERIKITVIQKAVGAISDSDVLLASASDAIIIGFQVRPSGSARKLAEKENIDIRLYSIIYDAINHVKDAIEGMTVPELQEVVVGNAEVREVFKISKVGTIAGSYVLDGIIKRGSNVRVIRDGIVVYTSKIKQLKRFKNDIQDAKTGFECGISLENFNDIKVGDFIESFEEQEI